MKNHCRNCGAECPELVCQPCLLDARATRFLAESALKAGVLCGPDFDFIDEAPMRAEEVLEFNRWLSEGTAVEYTRSHLSHAAHTRGIRNSNPANEMRATLGMEAVPCDE